MSKMILWSILTSALVAVTCVFILRAMGVENSAVAAGIAGGTLGSLVGLKMGSKTKGDE